MSDGSRTADAPLQLDAIQAFGPQLAYSKEEFGDSSVVPDKYVKTHCCFCGQQCGLQLKVKDNQVIGIEPWYEFPFNRGMLCPKGIKRYLQQGHPDRLLTAYERDASGPGGFRALPYDRAIARVGQEIERIQRAHGNDAFAILSGASLTTEKTYLMGKFAHACLRTSNIDYNGRLCMVSAAAANKKAFGVDRAANPWTDILGAEVIFVCGANVAECSPITTNYIWEARERGAKVIVADPRLTPLARTCDVFLPVKPGRDTALFNGLLHQLIEHGWIDRAFIDRHTAGFDAVAAEAAGWTLQRTAEVTGIAPKALQQAAELWGKAKTSFLMHARGLEHHSNGVKNCLSAINLVLATGRIGRPNCGYATITGQANGQGGREHGQKCDQLPGGRDLENPEHRAHVARVWGMKPEELPRSGVDAYEIMRKADRGEIKGLLSICFNPVVSLPDNGLVRRALEKLEFYVAIDFFMSETARYAHVVLPGSLQEEDEGTITQVEGRIIKVNKAVDPPGDARQDWRIIQDIAAALGRTHGMTFSGPKEIFEELRAASRGGVVDYSGVTWERVEENLGVFWPCPDQPPEGLPPLPPQGTVRLFEPDSWNPVAKGQGPFYFPDGKARFNLTPYVGPAEDVDAEYPIILTTGRVVSHFLSGNQTRRIGPLVDHCPEPLMELHPVLAKKLGIASGDWVTVQSRRGSITLKATVVRTIRPDTVFVPYHWGGRKSINQLTISAQDPISKIPEYKVCAVRVSKASGAPEYARMLEPQQ